MSVKFNNQLLVVVFVSSLKELNIFVELLLEYESLIKIEDTLMIIIVIQYKFENFQRVYKL